MAAHFLFFWFKRRNKFIDSGESRSNGAAAPNSNVTKRRVNSLFLFSFLFDKLNASCGDMWVQDKDTRTKRFKKKTSSKTFFFFLFYTLTEEKEKKPTY